MTELDPVLLSRIQFGLTITFHIIFPTMTIGLALFLTLVEGLWLWTKDELYLRIYRFWRVIFAMGFGVGVVTGIVLSFEFGTNFAKFAQMAGSVIGPLIALEVFTAFFIEAGFLGIMLFGMGRVSPRLHLLSTFMVALGSTISASWILAANSWMQTPAGFAIEDGRFVASDWWAVIFNPSYIVRLPHMLLAAYISASFLVAGVGAWYLLKRRHLDFARRTFSMGLGLAALFIGAQLFMGDTVAGRMVPLQPSKFQAMEGHWDTVTGGPYLLVVVPDAEKQANRFEWGLPFLGSVLTAHQVDGVIPGLKETPRADQPNMTLVFYAFRVMFLLAMVMFGAVCTSIWLRWRGKLFTARRFQRFMVIMTPVGYIATIAGWYTAEIGRQPWVIFGQLRTADAVSPVSGTQVLTTILIFIVAYAIFFLGFLLLTLRHISRGPDVGAPRAIEQSGTLKERGA